MTRLRTPRRWPSGSLKGGHRHARAAPGAERWLDHRRHPRRQKLQDWHHHGCAPRPFANDQAHRRRRRLRRPRAGDERGADHGQLGTDAGIPGASPDRLTRNTFQIPERAMRCPCSPPTNAVGAPPLIGLRRAKNASAGRRNDVSMFVTGTRVSGTTSAHARLRVHRVVDRGIARRAWKDPAGAADLVRGGDHLVVDADGLPGCVESVVASETRPSRNGTATATTRIATASEANPPPANAAKRATATPASTHAIAAAGSMNRSSPG